MEQNRQYQANTCLIQACKNLKLAYHYYDKNNNFIEIKTPKSPLFFTNSSTSFNTEAIAKICLDKDFTYLLLQDKIKMPFTTSFFDPNSLNKYSHYKDFLSQEEIVKHIENNFSLPVIIKRNSGHRGQNVFLCQNAEEIYHALEKIYHKKSQNYDCVALAQKYIKPYKEYRAIFFRQEIVLVYEKNINGANFTGNLSPLHFSNAKAIEITDKKILTKIQNFCLPIFNTLPIVFAGFDIIEDETGNFWLIEINTKPGFDLFLKNNPASRITQMYQTILEKNLSV